MIAPVDTADLDRSLVDRFDAVVATWPGKDAVRTPHGAIDYATLRARSVQIGTVLHAALAADADRGTRAVVILLPQGIEALAAQLGVLRAGGFYVPVDRDASADVLRDLVRRLEARIVLGNAATTARARAVLDGGIAVLDVAALPAVPAHAPDLPAVDPDALAYVYFTSGSTGTPKGVMDSHRNVLHNVLRYTRQLSIGPHDRLTLLQPPSFSGAVSSTYAALLNGGTVLPYDLAADGPSGLAPFLDAEGVTIYHSVPSIFRHFVAGRASFASLRFVRLEGDRALDRDARLFQRHFPRGCRLANGLGTTETGLVRQHFVDHETVVEDGPLPIGYAVPGADCSVERPDGTRCDAGEVGEIVVRGHHLALGYWRDEATTRHKFAEDAAGRCYRTGDLGRMRADGCLEYLGRAGGEVRVRGVTVDRTDVEQALLRLPGVVDAAVADADDDGERALVAGVAVGADAGWTTARLRQALARTLPEQAIPTRFVLAETLPLTPFGKVDRAAIAHAARRVAPPAHAVQRSADAIEQQVGAIWAAVLDLPAVDDDVPFLEQGGDSLRAMQILVRVHEAFGVRLTPATFFRLPTVAAQARAVREMLAQRPGA